MEKKKVLIFMDWYKPGFKAGGPIQSITNLVNLLFKEFDFYIVTRNIDYLEEKSYPKIVPDVWVKSKEESIFYLEYNKLRYSRIKSVIIELNPDIIYLNSLYSIYFSLIPMWLAKRNKIKTVLAVRGMLSEGSFSVKRKKKQVFLFLFKLFGIQNMVEFHATTVEEKSDILSRISTNACVSIVQNIPRVPLNKKYKSRGEVLKLIFVGRVAPEKNLLFAIKSVKLAKSNVVFHIYGPIYNQAYWLLCQNEMESYSENVNIKYCGVLEHNKLDSVMSNYHSLLLPSTGENFGHIISEGMMNFCIPLISNKTPWRNLSQLQVGFDLEIHNPKDFADKIDYLSSLEESQLILMAKNARDFIHNQTDLIGLYSSYKNLFN